MIWASGQRLQNGKLVIESVLGQGGFGITYKAHHTCLKVAVVIKTPNEHLRHDPDYDEYVARFYKEGQRLESLSQKQHPHIVRVRDLFDEGDIPCMVMDFVTGDNLFQLVRRRGALPEAEIVSCIRQIASALSVVHQAGLVHRDAHPGNIIVQKNGNAMLIDFGIAKELVPSTQSSVGVAGNRGFAPYEQITGSSSREPSVDVYCLAATLYYTVTGECPATALDRKLHDVALKPPNRLNPSISQWLNDAILQGMALEARKRPQSMEAWLQLLQAPAVRRRQAVRLPWRSLTSSLWGDVQQAFRPMQAARLPWRSLIVDLLLHTVIGSLLSLSFAPLGAVVVVAVVAVVVALAVVAALADGASSEELSLVFVAGGLAGVLAVAAVAAVAEAWARAAGPMLVFVPAAGAVAAAGAGAVAGEALLRSFTRRQTFLILAGIGTGGLGLGWFVGAGLWLMGVSLPG